MSYVAGVCVDNTEVTEGQYREFLAAKNGDTSGQPPQCDFNHDWQLPSEFTPVNEPRRGVDWCDARGFCEWAGKRMCGPIGSAWIKPAPAPHELGEVCYALFGTTTHEECRGGLVGSIRPVGSVPLCTGAPPNDQVFDILGNVTEWSGCYDDDSCMTVGGGAGGPFRCEQNRARRAIDYRDSIVGFRCCADPQ